MKHCIIYPVHPKNDREFRECYMETYKQATFDKQATTEDDGQRFRLLSTNFYIFDPDTLRYWRVQGEERAEHYYNHTELNYNYM